ncbi:MAG TPA: hypothetical protein VF779_03765 [Pyrinomonadaceae bacterium]
MKLLFILSILAIFALIIYIRLRPFIRMTRQMFGAVREARRVVHNEPSSSTRTGGAGDKLVRCGSCSTWIPSSRAIRLRSSNTAYCSHTCLENAATGSKRKAAG